MNRRIAALSLLILALSAGPAAAQAPQSPHGELTGVACESCHTDDGWTPVKSPMDFDHDESTAFPLTGRHDESDCATCHISLRFDEPGAAGAECTSCHIDVHRGSLGADCAACHDTESFTQIPTGDAHLRTSFPLTGAHLQLSCESCHFDEVGGQFAPLDTDCASCHESDYRNAQLVDHVANAYPLDCLECHTVVAWRQAPLFDHVALASGFELLGAHAQTGCDGCHLRPGNELRYAPAPTGQQDCVACHRADYDEEHGGSAIPTECGDCHNVSDWDGAIFDHALTGFPLEGPHGSLGCENCHREPGNELIFPRPATPADCVSCHRADFDREHAGSGFATTCLDCHVPGDWGGAEFDHALTGFDLLGAHQGAPCADCHQQPGNQLLFPVPNNQDDCVSCHQADYNAEHAGTGFATTCLDCHNATQFAGAVFNHTGLGFDLVGAHVPLLCTKCHNPVDNSLLFQIPNNQDDCVACHQADYNANHAGSGYPTTCLSCHNTTQFAGAVFDHDALFFPIYSGKHKDEWNNNCASCHLAAPASFSTFSCINCHEHSNKSKVDNDHSQVQGYAYVSSACLSCHPQGN